MLPMPPYPLALIFFKIGEHFSKQPIHKKLYELLENQKLSSDELHNLRINKLKRLLTNAKEFCPYYSEILKHINVEHINSFDILKEIPILTKNRLLDNIDTIKTKKQGFTFHTAKTSGSTGIPLKFPKDSLTTAYHYAAMFRGHFWHGLKIADREARLWGVPVDKKTLYKTLCKDYLLNRFREKKYNLFDANLRQFYKMMQLYKPDYLMGYGKMLFEFALFLDKFDLNLSHLNLKFAKFTSEGITKEQIKFIESQFSCPVISEYGAAETGIVAFQCTEGNHHIMHDCVHVEYLEPDIIQKQENIKEILVTDLNNISFPIIRYKLGDFVKPEKNACQCGIKFPTLASIEGRSSNSFYVHGNKKFHSIVFYYIMKKVAETENGLFQFKVVQDELKSFSYHLACNQLSKTTEQLIISKTKQELGQDIEVNFKYFRELERDKSGKLRDFVPYDNKDMKRL
jgi:phenylacetate-CoA ligase